MAERPPRRSAIDAARDTDWVPKPNKDVGYLLDSPVRGDEPTQDGRYRPARYDARLQHALDGVIRLWGECCFCDRIQAIDLARVPSRFKPSSFIRDLERWLRCTSCGARAREGAEIDLLFRPSWEAPITERDGRPVVWIPREPKPKLFGKGRR